MRLAQSEDPRFQLDAESQSDHSGSEDQTLEIDMNESDSGSDQSCHSDEDLEVDQELDWDLDKFQQESQQDKDSESEAPKHKPLSLGKLSKFQSRLDASGVIYLSRIPPFMKPVKLRSLLSKFGKLGRIYLAPEDPKSAAKRKKYKKNKRQNYVEGWVEFLDKKVARSTAQMLNNTSIGGKKRSYYYDDIWTLKYLPRFKWNHLTEQIAYELKVREQKMKTELSQTKRENKIYLKNVEKAKMIQGMKEKRTAKLAKEVSKDDAPTDSVQQQEKGGMDMAQIKRRFKQRKVQGTPMANSELSSKSKETNKTALFSRLFS